MNSTLKTAVDWEVQTGARVVFFSPYEVVLVRFPVPMSASSHILHLLLTMFSGGLWAIIWIAQATGRGRPRRYGIGVDTFGNLYGFDPAQREQQAKQLSHL